MLDLIEKLKLANNINDLDVSERTRLKLNVFRDICLSISSLSPDEKYKVGSIIVTGDLRDICAIGYNGNYKGGPNVRESQETGGSGFLHSEENALLHLDKPYELRDTLIMFCTHEPCPMCAKRIVNSGVRFVLFVNEYKDLGHQAREIFSLTGVKCLKM